MCVFLRHGLFSVCIVSVWGYSFLFVLFQCGVTVSRWYCFSMGLQFPVCVVSARSYNFQLVLFQYGISVSCLCCFSVGYSLLFQYGVTVSCLCCFSVGLQFPVCDADQPVLADGHSGFAVHEVQTVQDHPHVHGGASCWHAGGKWSARPYTGGQFLFFFLFFLSGLWRKLSGGLLSIASMRYICI